MGLSRFLKRPGETGDTSDAPGIENAEFLISNMVCEGCAETLDDALRAVPGVQQVTPKVTEKRIRVRYDSARVDAEQLRAAIACAGFTVTEPNR